MAEKQYFIGINKNIVKEGKIGGFCLTSRGSGVRIPQLPQRKETYR